jgi:membrane associated rhomboid family serine protease
MNGFATIALVVANVLVYLVQGPQGGAFFERFALWPLQGAEGEPPFQIWQLLTHAFMHGNNAHILFNMFGLWMFGRDVERLIGSARFATLYFCSVITSGLAQLLIPPLLHAPPLPTVGASGGVFGVLLAFAVFFPNRKIILLLAPIPMPAWLFAIGYALVELFSGVTGLQQGVAHFAHLGGMVGSGVLLAFWYRRRLGDKRF